MRNNGLPAKQGLYDPKMEHDACGIGFIVDIEGKKSHTIVKDAITVLENLSHRGASGADPDTGDGAGILVQIPHTYLSRECKTSGFELPELGEYGVGMIFANRNQKIREIQKDKFEKIIREEGQGILGWREVPIDESVIGDTAKKSRPYFLQVFIKKNESIEQEKDFERILYIIRRRAEKVMNEVTEDTGGSLYIASLSAKTIVYKGLLTAEQLGNFYLDLVDLDFISALAMVHSRFSTNTFPSWERAHPNRYTIHNGEINTIRGNVNWIKAEESTMKSQEFGEDLQKIFPVIDEDGSDSSMFDNALEFMHLTGRELPHAMMMMIPEPWEKNKDMDVDKRSFYEYHSCLMEPWDGPAAVGFTDGEVVGAVLDRNGLRPSRYYVTKDKRVILASEVGVVDIKPSEVLKKGRLEPGRMLLIDTKEKRIIDDKEIKKRIATDKPYREWISKYLIDAKDLPKPKKQITFNKDTLLSQQKAFGYTNEVLDKMLLPMVLTSKDPIGAMGMDTPLAVLSEKPQMLYRYFKQLFAQVTNPPIDGLREELITSAGMVVGNPKNLLEPTPEDAKQIKLKHSILTNEQCQQFKEIKKAGFKSEVISILFDVNKANNDMEKVLEEIFDKADKAIEKGVNIIILSDRGINKDKAPIPTLLAIAGLHHHLIRSGNRMKVSLIAETGEAREVHDFCLLIGYGVTAINPYLAYETIESFYEKGLIEDLSYKQAEANYIKASYKGIVKVLTKMGISTTRSYQGAQIFEAIGIKSEVINRYFTNTATRIEGIGMEEIAEEVRMRHQSAYASDALYKEVLNTGGLFQNTGDGETHMYNPEMIYTLQKACREGDYDLYKTFSRGITKDLTEKYTIRNLLDFNYDKNESINIDEVESVSEIVRRFKTGAMSYGSLSQEAHECLAVAMNRLGGKSNSGEGGERIERYELMPNGDSKCSSIKQIASGRFGVTSNYLSHATELQIKMAQGAKPGEGGHLPGKKVYPWIAKTRHSTPGVGLISPPPHHDIYSIEDLGELIFDLKNANRDARINVKLVSEVGVGTIAAGVAKAKADVVLISGYDGGTGAAPRTSIANTGLPWELGLAETHQTLVLNNLRNKIVIEADGKMLTGRDIAVAALLGAEEYGFATTPLIVMGCIMMRVCNLNTCPVGVATQDENLRKNFIGKPEHVVNYMTFVAEELREIMAKLGFKTIDEMVGRTDKLKHERAEHHWKAKNVDLSSLLYQPLVGENTSRYCTDVQEHNIDKTMDMQKLMRICQAGIDEGKSIIAKFEIKNTDRVVSTIIGNEVTKKYGEEGLPEDTIKLQFVGSAGQSFGAFIPRGMTLELEGDSNDYIGKGLSGGNIIVSTPKESTFKADENIIIGNVAFYGATAGNAFINGIAGERFCVRNSGVTAVVEGVGDHGCEYMTGGKVIILGNIGRNFAAGMSGGIAYILDSDNNSEMNINLEMVETERVTDEKEIHELQGMIKEHVRKTDSAKAKEILVYWEEMLPKFIKVIPTDFKKITESIDEALKQGADNDEALMIAFKKNQ
jgi:glutamate synthase (ferredoxin)